MNLNPPPPPSATVPGNGGPGGGGGDPPHYQEDYGRRYAADQPDDPVPYPDPDSEGSWDEGYARDHGRLCFHVYAPAPCKVPRYKIGTQLTIESCFYQKKNYFEANRIPKHQRIKFCISNFHSQQYEQVRHHRYLTYRDFKRKLIDMLRKPDLTQYKIKQLWEIEQATEEEPDAFMNRFRLLPQEAFRKLPDDEQQMLASMLSGSDSRIELYQR